MPVKNEFSSDAIFEQYKEAWIGETDLDIVDINAAKPELTTIFIGPPRMILADNASNTPGPFVNVKDGIAAYSGEEKIAGLVPLGAAQSVQWSISRQQMPIGIIGSANKAFASSDSTMGQLFIQNLVVPDTLMKKVTDYIGKISGYIGAQPEGNFVSHFELDTIIGEIPIGILVVEFNKANKAIGKHYFEACKIQSVSRGITTGQAIMFDSVSFMFHRIKSFGQSK